MIKEKQKKDKIVQAYPQVPMLSAIQIREKEQLIGIGGFSVDGGFYLKSPYELVKDEIGGITGDLTYYNFVKSSKKMCEQEKALRKIETDKEKYERKRKKELQEELKKIEGEKVHNKETSSPGDEK